MRWVSQIGDFILGYLSFTCSTSGGGGKRKAFNKNFRFVFFKFAAAHLLNVSFWAFCFFFFFFALQQATAWEPPARSEQSGGGVGPSPDSPTSQAKSCTNDRLNTLACVPFTHHTPKFELHLQLGEPGRAGRDCSREEAASRHRGSSSCRCSPGLPGGVARAARRVQGVPHGGPSESTSPAPAQCQALSLLSLPAAWGPAVSNNRTWGASPSVQARSPATRAHATGAAALR